MSLRRRKFQSRGLTHIAERISSVFPVPGIVMSVELRPLGVSCNLSCPYCYQNPQRDAGNVSRAYDMQRMKAAIEKEGKPFTLFGGEPLLLPLTVLEEIWSFGLERFGSNAVQTNGTILTAAHIDLFRKYKVSVGLSMDGPGELNDLRTAANTDATKKATLKSERAIEMLCEAGIYPTVIITLHRLNAHSSALPAMNEWILRLERLGVHTVRLHTLESETDAIRKLYGLSEEESLTALMNFARLEKVLTTLRFDVFNDIRRLLLGEDLQTSCTWNACDPYTTPAVRGIEGNGQRSNCGRTNKEGIDFLKADFSGYERYIALYHTDQAFGGCSGCRFFLACKGQCPGEARDGDWRNRSEHCKTWMGLFEHIERELVAENQTPISLRNDRGQLEQRMLDQWTLGKNPRLKTLLQMMKSSPAGPLPSAG